ncbi:MAG: hypothetical protein R2708_24115 [Vicinamibacterales bacterium]
MDTIRRKVRRGATGITLKPKEYALLEFLLRHDRPVTSRSSSSTCGTSTSTASATRRRGAHQLAAEQDRQGFSPALIHTIRGVGYILTDHPE